MLYLLILCGVGAAVWAALIGLIAVVCGWPRLDDDYDPLELSIRPNRSTSGRPPYPQSTAAEPSAARRAPFEQRATSSDSSAPADRMLEIIGDNCWRRWRLWVTAVELRAGVWWCFSRLGWHTLPELAANFRPL